MRKTIRRKRGAWKRTKINQGPYRTEAPHAKGIRFFFLFMQSHLTTTPVSLPPRPPRPPSPCGSACTSPPGTPRSSSAGTWAGSPARRSRGGRSPAGGWTYGAVSGRRLLYFDPSSTGLDRPHPKTDLGVEVGLVEEGRAVPFLPHLVHHAMRGRAEGVVRPPLQHIACSGT